MVMPPEHGVGVNWSWVTHVSMAGMPVCLSAQRSACACHVFPVLAGSVTGGSWHVSIREKFSWRHYEDVHEQPGVLWTAIGLHAVCLHVPSGSQDPTLRMATLL